MENDFPETTSSIIRDIKKELLLRKPIDDRLEKLYTAFENLTGKKYSLDEPGKSEVKDLKPITIVNREVISQYPLKGPKEQKVVFVLNKVGHACLKVQIEQSINDLEGSEAKYTLKSFYHLLRKVMIPEGKLVYIKFNNSVKHTFYALPEWLDTNKRIKKEYTPLEESWGNMPIQTREKMATTKWQTK